MKSFPPPMPDLSTPVAHKNLKSPREVSMGIFIFIVGIILIVLVSIFYMSLFSQNQTDLLVLPKFFKKSLETPDPTLSWKIFKSQERGFSIRYPKSYHHDYYSYQTSDLKNQVYFDTFSSTYHSISVYSYKSGVSSGVQFEGEALPTQQIAIAGANAIKKVGKDGKLIHIGPFQHGLSEYLIVYSSSLRDEKTEFLFYQILSTFKFLDENKQTTTAPSISIDGLPAPVQLAVKDLAVQLTVAPEKIAVVEMKKVDWPDTSLGCPQEGMLYAQVITAGYSVILLHEGKTYRYHTDQAQKAIQCDNTQ